MHPTEDVQISVESGVALHARADKEGVKRNVLTEHLGYPKHYPAGSKTGNTRHRKSSKRLKGDSG